SANSIAPNAESFKMDGALKPQCVTSSGPSLHKLVPKTFTSTCGATTPGIPEIRSSLILKVNSDGTGCKMVCPNASNNFHILRLLHVATKCCSAENISFEVSI